MSETRYEPEDLKVFCERVLTASGVPEGDARVVADSLVRADVEGAGSRGVSRLAVYSRRIREGRISLLLGAMVGALGCGPLSDRWGRRTVVLLAGVVFAVGSIGAGLAPGPAVVILFRFVMGLAVGVASVTVPIYLSELAPPHLRGRLSGLNQIMLSSGILLAYLVSLALGPAEARRWMFALGVVPALLLLAGVYFQPESPRWLVKKGRENEARQPICYRIDQGGAVSHSSWTTSATCPPCSPAELQSPA